VIYALPVHIDQYASTIKDLIQVFSHTEISVDLKFHPLYRLDDVKGIPVLPSNFRVIEEVNMQSLRENYDCVLFHDNSFGIEALLMGVKSYQYGRNGSFVDDRFIYFDLWNVNYQLSDIHQLKISLLSGAYDKSFNVRAVSDYVNAMYYPYGPGPLDSFRKFLPYKKGCG
jgi:hypothetical protein